MRIAALALLLGALLPVRPVLSPRPLTGTWEARFTLDSTWQLPDAPERHAIAGRIVFGPGTATDSLHPEPVYPGHSELDFSPFGFQVRSADALGWYLGGDSIRAILDPQVDHGHVALVGRGREGRFEGAWTMVGYPTGARGRFVLTRRGRS